jgi:hypothetical protein
MKSEVKGTATSKKLRNTDLVGPELNVYITKMYGTTNIKLQKPVLVDGSA